MPRVAALAFLSLLLPGFVFAQTPMRPKIYGMAFVRVKASDFQKSSETYSKVLGLGTGINEGNNGCTNVKNPCFVINVSQHVELVPARPGDSGSWLDEVAFETSSARLMREYLLSIGAPASELKTAANGGALVEARDPEGNRIAFVEGATGHIAPQVINRSQPGPSQVSARLFHAGFVVKDLTLMKRFYVDQLGFHLYWKGGFKDLPAGTPEKDSDIDWYEIQVPDGSDWVEFMLNIPANADHAELGVQNHFCLGVRDMAKAVEQLRNNGMVLGSKYADDKAEIGRDGKWQFDIFDPDLTRVELMEPSPAKEPCCNPYTAPHAKL
jgi:catechol 2,3-dioxygenase-like lactoylglutathione lyase family enzyme